MKNTEAVLRVISSGTQNEEQFVALLAALGFAVIPKGDAEHLERVRRKTGGVHPTSPGNWQTNATQNGWVSFWAGFNSNESPGMFSPGEAREIAMTLILMAEQEERRR